MHLYSADYLILFLPLFMGVYALLPPHGRPAAITFANVLFLAAAGKYGLIGFVLSLLSAYFSGISIYNMRGRPEKALLRKRLLGANIILYIAVFVFFALSGTGGLKRTLLDPTAVYCHAVIPLHLISYLMDVYRGDCEARTRIMSFAAYAGFFPSISFGPVMKYKCFVSSFEAPGLTAKKLTSGVRLYIIGLAEYLLLSRQLEAVRSEIINAPDSLRGGTAWIFVPVFYALFAVSMVGLLNMGRGTALMLGFNVLPHGSRDFFEPSLKKRLAQFNAPLSRWFADYLTKPAGVLFKNKELAAALSVCAAALWFRLSLGWLVTGIAAGAAVMIRSFISDKYKGIPKAVDGLLTMAFMLMLVMVCAFMELPSAGMAIFGSTRGGDTAYVLHLVRECIIPLTAALIISGSLLPALVRKVRAVWIRSLIPVIDVLLLIVDIAFITNTV